MVTLGRLQRWENLSTGQLLGMHFTKLTFIEEWQKKAIQSPVCRLPQAMGDTENMWKKVL